MQTHEWMCFICIDGCNQVGIPFILILRYKFHKQVLKCLVEPFVQSIALQKKFACVFVYACVEPFMLCSQHKREGKSSSFNLLGYLLQKIACV